MAMTMIYRLRLWTAHKLALLAARLSWWATCISRDIYFTYGPDLGYPPEEEQIARLKLMPWELDDYGMNEPRNPSDRLH